MSDKCRVTLWPLGAHSLAPPRQLAAWTGRLACSIQNTPYVLSKCCKQCLSNFQASNFLGNCSGFSPSGAAPMAHWSCISASWIQENIANMVRITRKKGNMQCQTPQRKTLHSATFRMQILDKHIPTPIKVSNTSEAAPCPKGLHQFQEVTTKDQNNLNSMLIEFWKKQARKRKLYTKSANVQHHSMNALALSRVWFTFFGHTNSNFLAGTTVLRCWRSERTTQDTRIKTLLENKGPLVRMMVLISIHAMVSTTCQPLIIK